MIKNAEGENCYDHATFIQEYFDKTWTPDCLPISTAGPYNSFLSVQLDVYPVKAAEIKKVYLTPLVPAPTGLPLLGLSKFTIQHPGEAGQESKAKKGIAKIMLLCIWGDVDFDTGAVPNVALAQPAAGMQLILNNPRVGQASALADLMRQNFMLAKD